MPRRIVIDSRFPDRLRRLREREGLSLRELAGLALSSKSHLHDFESGRKVPSGDTVRRLDQVLHADGELIRMVGEEGGAVRRRELMGLAGTALAGGWLSGREAGHDLVIGARIRVARLRRLDDHLGGAETYQLYLDEMEGVAATLRSGGLSPSTGVGLLAVVAELAQMAGFSAFDAGWHREARRLFQTSRTAAQEAGDVALEANALTFIGYQQLALSRSGTGLSRTACEMTSGMNGGVAALMHERFAWALAVEGDVAGTQASLAAAESALYGGRSEPDPDWVHWVDPVEVKIMTGRCWSVLHRPVRAIEALETALASYADTHSRDKALYTLYLAHAYLDAHEVEQACDLAETAMCLAGGIGSARPREHLTAIATRLESHDRLPRVTEFRDRLTAWIRTNRPSIVVPRKDMPVVPPRSVPR